MDEVKSFPILAYFTTMLINKLRFVNHHQKKTEIAELVFGNSTILAIWCHAYINIYPTQFSSVTQIHPKDQNFSHWLSKQHHMV